MSALLFIHFFCSVTYLNLAIFILARNTWSNLNRSGALLLCLFSLWSLCIGFTQTPSVPKELTVVLYNISSIGWIGFSAVFLWFTFIFTNQKNILKNKFTWLPLFGVPLILIYAQWRGHLTTGYIKQAYGWSYVWAESIWFYIFCFYYLFFIGASLYLIFNLIQNTRFVLKRKQATIIFISASVAIALGSVNNIILQKLKIHGIPPFADVISASLWTGGLVYAMLRYKFFNISSAANALELISNITDFLILLDSRGNIVTLNKATADSLGYTRSALVGMPINRILTAGSDLSDAIVRGEENIKSYEVYFKGISGKNMPMLVSTFILRDETEATAGIVCMAKDISAHKKAEENLEEAMSTLQETRQQLIQAEKMQVIGVLASGLAHEVKNPLGIIIQGVNFLEKKIPPEQETTFNVLAMIKESVKKADDIVASMYDFAHTSALNLQAADINLILENALKLVSQSMRSKRIEIILEMKKNLPKVLADKNRLEQVFINLLLNAVQAIQREGKIIIATYDIEFKELKGITDRIGAERFQSEEKVVIIKIKDSGTGISQVNLKKVFSPFFTTKGPGEGLGMGLPICRDIIDMHKGMIEIKSELGQGAEVIIALKLAETK